MSAVRLIYALLRRRAWVARTIQANQTSARRRRCARRLEFLTFINDLSANRWHEGGVLGTTGQTMKMDAIDYYARRAAQERLAADEAVDPRARESHLELARRYDEAAQGRGAANDDGREAPIPSSLPGLTML